MSEFNIIDEYFNWGKLHESIVKGVGDDAAILEVPSDKSLVVSVDTSLSGVHFPENTRPFDIAWKSLAVNLSDLAAMGATAEWFTLALTLPSGVSQEDKAWLASFSEGLKVLSDQSGCKLVGGDTTKGALSITIQVMGFVDKGKGLLRSGAKIGDKLYVTGTVGDAAVGLSLLLSDSESLNINTLDLNGQHYCKKRLNQPTPRISESRVIKEFASSCIDLSDGLLQDLSHVLKVSNVGATINLSAIPLSDALMSINRETALSFVFKGGDDYELLFTIPEEDESAFLSKIGRSNVACIGTINDQVLSLTDYEGNKLQAKGYNHFL